MSHDGLRGDEPLGAVITKECCAVIEKVLEQSRLGPELRFASGCGTAFDLVPSGGNDRGVAQCPSSTELLEHGEVTSAGAPHPSRCNAVDVYDASQLLSIGISEEGDCQFEECENESRFTHSDARNDDMVLRTSVSLFSEFSSYPGVSTSRKHWPSIKNGRDISTFSAELARALPMRSGELLTVLMNYRIPLCVSSIPTMRDKFATTHA